MSFAKSFLTSTIDSILGSDRPLLKVDSPRIIQERKSTDFDTSSIRSPRNPKHHARRRTSSPLVDDLSSSTFMRRYETLNENFAKGAYGKISLALDRITKEKVVIKRIRKTTPIRMIQNEVKAGNLLGYHPNIVTFHRYADFIDHHTLVFNYVNGSDLFSFMEKTDFCPLSDSAARSIISSLISALQHSHSKSIAHRDLKLENILIDSSGNISLLDYGLCYFVEDNRLITDHCGSDHYVAPEVVRRIPYCPYAADIFSLGVVSFAIVFGVFPFDCLRVNGPYSHDPHRTLPKLKLRIPSDVPVSDHAKDFITQMLEDDPNKRITLDEMLRHPWMNGGVAEPSIFLNLKQSNEA